jgi:hypothetical protein
MRWQPALVAQRIRASDYGSEGWGFESLRAHSIARAFFLVTGRNSVEGGSRDLPMTLHMTLFLARWALRARDRCASAGQGSSRSASPSASIPPRAAQSNGHSGSTEQSRTPRSAGANAYRGFRRARSLRVSVRSGPLTDRSHAGRSTCPLRGSNIAILPRLQSRDEKPNLEGTTLQISAIPWRSWDCVRTPSPHVAVELDVRSNQKRCSRRNARLLIY